MARKKQAEEAGSSGDDWAVSFADMMSLLCVLFIVLFSMANTDLKNFARVAESLRLAFNGAGNSPAPAIVDDTQQASSEATSTLPAAPIFVDGLPPKRRDFLRVSAELSTLASELGIESEVNITSNYEGIIISLSERMVFEPGSAELRPEALEVLDHVAEILQVVDNPIRVEGHTDDIPTNSPLYPSNWELSVIRAVRIVRYLTEVGGVAPARMLAAGNAEFKPLVPNNSRENRAMNRRADIVVIYPNDSRTFSLSNPSVTEEPGAPGILNDNQ
ncbi:MAG: flagellar motor protein MotB [Anaerolineae bacterium]|nr:flagellar motor protein MotB [Anaerolineae bacterium]